MIIRSKLWLGVWLGAASLLPLAQEAHADAPDFLCNAYRQNDREDPGPLGCFGDDNQYAEISVTHESADRDLIRVSIWGSGAESQCKAPDLVRCVVDIQGDIKDISSGWSMYRVPPDWQFMSINCNCYR